MTVSMIVNLPDDVFLEILANILDLKSVTLLDTSFCNAKVRNYVLSLFCSPLLSLKGNENLSQSSIKYLACRGLKICSFDVNRSFFEVMFENPPLNTSKITTLSESYTFWFPGSAVVEANMAACWTELINLCPKLTSLSTEEGWWVNETTIGLIDVKILRQLKILRVGMIRSGFHGDKRAFIAIECRCLTEVNLILSENMAKIILQKTKCLQLCISDVRKENFLVILLNLLKMKN